MEGISIEIVAWAMGALSIVWFPHGGGILQL